MKNLIIVVFCLFLANSALATEVPVGELGMGEAGALEAAKSWLQLIDAEDYGKAWERAAPLLKNSVSKKKFTQQLKTARQTLGKALSRKLISKKKATALPGVPDGTYVVIQFETTFENKNSAIETITPKFGPDKKVLSWRIAGYYIK